MNADNYAVWLRRQGYHIIRTASCYWFQIVPWVYQAVPPHWVITPHQTELEEIWGSHKALGLRYSTPLEVEEGKISYHVVYQGENYLLGALHKKVRYDIQKAQKVANIEQISFARLASDGWKSRYETLTRQGRIGAETQRWWNKLCMSADGLDGFETWAAISDGKLVASLIAFSCDDCCSILYQQSQTEYLSYGVNNALTFTFTSEALNRPGIKWMFYGVQSLDAPASVDQYKFRMNFSAKPVRQRVVFHPWLTPLFNPASHAALRGLLRLMPGSPSLAKTEGMVRFFLEGKEPLVQQDWPLPLLQNKEALERAQELKKQLSP